MSSDKFGPKRTEKQPSGQIAETDSPAKKLQGDLGPIEIETPRDRESTFEPQIVGKHQRRVEGFDEKILALYAKGMTTRDIQDLVKELYGVDVSAGFDQPGHRGSRRGAEVLAIANAAGVSFPSCSSTESWCMFEVAMPRYRPTRSTSRWASILTARKSCWAFGSPRPRVRSSGSVV